MTFATNQEWVSEFETNKWINISKPVAKRATDQVERQPTTIRQEIIIIKHNIVTVNEPAARLAW